MLATSQMGAPRLPAGDIENAPRLPWRDPADAGTECDEGLAELFDTAVLRAAELLKAAGRYFDRAMGDDAFAAVVGNAGYDTGKTSMP